jgi:hypothetical protein
MLRCNRRSSLPPSLAVAPADTVRFNVTPGCFAIRLPQGEAHGFAAAVEHPTRQAVGLGGDPARFALRKTVNSQSTRWPGGQIEIGHARLPSFVTDRSSSGGRSVYYEYHATRRVHRDAAIASAIEAMSFLTSEGSTPSLFIIWRTTHEASSSSRLACRWGNGGPSDGGGFSSRSQLPLGIRCLLCRTSAFLDPGAQ